MSSSALMFAMVALPTPSGGRYELTKCPVPVPRATEVLVAVKGSALNRGEQNALERLVDPAKKPTIGGIEFSGIVVGLGETVTRWKLGDEVMARSHGGFAQFATCDERALMVKPPSVSWPTAAAIPNVFITAHDAIVTAGVLRKGETVLITAGSSGVGVAAIQIAKYMGASKILVTSRSPSKKAKLHSLGADLVIDSERPDWTDEVMETTSGKGVDMVVDQVGSTLLAANLKILSIGGRLLTVGRNAGSKAVCDLDEIARKNAKIIGTSFRSRTVEQVYDCVDRFKVDLMDAFLNGKMVSVVDRCFKLEAIAEAQAYLCSNNHVGKISLDINI